MLTVNLDSVFHDPATWKDPENFRPERHLDANGNIVKNDAFIPFGLGIIDVLNIMNRNFCVNENF